MDKFLRNSLMFTINCSPSTDSQGTRYCNTTGAYNALSLVSRGGNGSSGSRLPADIELAVKPDNTPGTVCPE